ncbi:uncharacterized protein LOC113284790 [Papaver somniferum]|uniref:uncharacterized protein LOC113284790 n=1 Tax=Papaver somniferum TaxID=3469 RepID=UPI000E6F58B8|nr:uncharacterized protein LOC113284790 [Papaver somniferum]
MSDSVDWSLSYSRADFLLKLQRGLESYNSSVDKCPFLKFDSIRIVFDPVKKIDVLRSGNYVYELILGVWYCFEVLFEYLYMFLFGINGDSGNASMLVGKIMQLECAPRDKLILHSTRNNKPGNEWSLRGQESLKRVVGIKKMFVKTNGSGLKWVFMLILGSPSLIICGSNAGSSNKVESYEWGWGILNRVVKAEEMSVDGALPCTQRVQDNIETRRVKDVIARVMRALYKEDYTINLQLRCVLLVQRMLILVTAQHLARWWRDKMHSSRVAMLVKAQGFHSSLLNHGDGLAYYMMKYFTQEVRTSRLNL